MGHPLRWYLPDVIYEVTTRTFQERYLLRPGVIERAVILGVLGRALALYQHVRLHAFVYLSNHMHMLLSALDASQLAPFIGHVNGNVAKRIGDRHDWNGHFWASRASVIPVLDDESAEGRLRYIVSHGVKEGLVARPEDWPGASSTPALLGESLRGQWVTSKGTPKVAVAGESRDDESTYTVPITPLPAWARLPPAERIARARALCDSIAGEYRARRDAPVLGVEGVLVTNPLDRPEAPARRPAPRCHVASSQRRASFTRARALFTAMYRAAAHANEGEHIPYRGGFPPGSYGGRRKFVSSTTCVAPWLEHAIPSPWGATGGSGNGGGSDLHHYSGDPGVVTTTRSTQSGAPPTPPQSAVPTRSPPSSGDGGDAARSPPLRPKRPPKRDRVRVSSA